MRPTLRPPPPASRSDDTAEGCLYVCFILAILAFLTLTSLLGWAAWATIFWGVARLFGGA